MLPVPKPDSNDPRVRALTSPVYLFLLMLSTDGFMCVDSGCVYLHILSCGECGSVAVLSLEL